MAGAGYDDTQLLRDSQGAPIPQQYDPAGAVFRQLTGVNVDTGRYGMDTVTWGKTAGGVYVPLQINANGQLQIAGAAAHDAPASGNPVQVAGVYRLADPALADGDAGSIRLNAKGEPIVQLSGSIATRHILAGVAGAAYHLFGDAANTNTASGTSYVPKNISTCKNMTIIVRNKSDQAIPLGKVLILLHQVVTTLANNGAGTDGTDNYRLVTFSNAAEIPTSGTWKVLLSDTGAAVEESAGVPTIKPKYNAKGLFVRIETAAGTTNNNFEVLMLGGAV